MEKFFKKLRDLGVFLCPEPGECWSVSSVDGNNGEPYFRGWGSTPEEALKEAEDSFKKWHDQPEY